MEETAAFSVNRRDLLKGAGALVVTFAAPAEALAAAGDAASATAKPPLEPEELDSWIAVQQNGKVTAFFGKTDNTQGTYVAIGQIVAEELDVPYERVTVVMGDTERTVNQGGASGSTGVQRGGMALRNAAAEALRLLVEMEAKKLGVPVEQLKVVDGIVISDRDGKKRASYGELIGGRYFQAKLDWNHEYGNPLLVKGKAKPKPVDAYTIVGKPYKRSDIAHKVFARLDYITDVRVPGMVHARMIRPPVAGAVPVAIDEASVRDIPGVRIVHREGFLGVVAEREWDAIRAARRLKVSWSQAAPPFVPFDQIYDYIRKAPVRKREVALEKGQIEPAFAGAAKLVSAEYEWPFQSHSSMGPGCAIVAIKDGKATLWSGTSKPHFAREGVAKILGLAPADVHTVWVQGPGAYGRNDAGDAAIDAAVLAQAVGRAVRLQYMRYEGHGWDPKGPASIHRARAALDASGKVIAYQFESKGFSRWDVFSTEADPRHSLAGQLMGMPIDSRDAFNVPAESYGFANKLLAWETIAPQLDRASPLRSSHLRDPVGPQVHFASESFIDEVAVAAGSDPVAFRLQYLTEPRDIAVVKAAAEKANWQPRVAGPQGRGANDGIAHGRGFAYAQRNNTIVAEVAEVEVDLRSGKVRPVRVVVAHDCGLIVNPEQLRLCIEGNVIHASSRSLEEEVKFDREQVTSIDWKTYPILDIADAPVAVETVLINRPEVAPQGAGEASSRPLAAALANAIYDATGTRVRRAPFTPERVRSGQA